MSHRRRRIAILLPGEKEGRRGFLKSAAAITALAAAGGGTWLGTRRPRDVADAGGPLRVFTAAEAAVLLAIADRLIPPREGFPRPRDLHLATRMDAIAAMAHPATQGELRKAVRLFDNALTGLLLDGTPELFVEALPHRQDGRLAAWADSRIGLRRTAFRALKRLVYAAYYGAPETWRAVGYPGPPFQPAPASGDAHE